MIRPPLSLALLALVVGCTPTHSLKEVRPDASQSPSVVLHVSTQGNVPGHELRNLIRASGLFLRVEDGPAGSAGYTVQINATSSQTELDEQRPAKGLVETLAQGTQPIDTRLDFTVLRGEVPLKTYHYQNHSEYPPVGVRPKAVRLGNLRLVVNRFLADLQQDRLLQAPARPDPH